MNTEAMTDERLQLLRIEYTRHLLPREVGELLDEIDRMRACKVCDGARVLFNDGGTMRPAHGWTGPLVSLDGPTRVGTPILVGQAYVCLSCKAMDAAQATPPSLPLRSWSPAPQLLWTEDVSLSEMLTTITGQRGLGLSLLPEDIGAYHFKGGFDATHLSLAGVLDEVTQLMGWTWKQSDGLVTVRSAGAAMARHMENAPHSKDDIAAAAKRLLGDGPTAEDFEGLTRAVLLARPGMPEQ